MAAIDKIYGTKAQYDEFHAWCEEYLPEALPYFYEHDWDDSYKGEWPLTNFPENVDMKLIEKCPLKWVQDYLKEQYPRIRRLK